MTVTCLTYFLWMAIARMSALIYLRLAEKGTILFILPPHSPHVLQPLNISFFRPAKERWKQAVADFQRENPGTPLNRRTLLQVFQLYWENQVEGSHLIQGLRRAGICPYNPDAVNRSQSIPSEVHQIQRANEPNRDGNTMGSQTSSLLHVIGDHMDD